jgi:hypothetical protein
MTQLHSRNYINQMTQLQYKQDLSAKRFVSQVIPASNILANRHLADLPITTLFASSFTRTFLAQILSCPSFFLDQAAAALGKGSSCKVAVAVEEELKRRINVGFKLN